MARNKITAPRIVEMKREGVPIAALTAYDATFAAVQDKAGLDIILVGDSAGMVVAGDPDTLSITLDEMIFLCRNASRGVKHALLVGDMPFGSAQLSTEATISAAVRFMKEGRAEAVKVEGAGPALAAIRRMTAMGIPIMGHLGLTPQSVNSFGGYGLRGATDIEAQRIRDDALALQDAGVFSIVLEKIPIELARVVTEDLDVPTIGIGAGPHCDGQILVSYDMFGLGPKFRFVRRYLEGDRLIDGAVRKYIEDVRNRDFPSEDESFAG
ncbi:MAG: 3-methyl-2-oxobutanoate hydroxymethyltransferase [Calditrichaeota bacterium]|nr:3-methyl-2-oxobutanoate hydroxymethyltransferase [Calditrichota bacterium]